MAQLAKTKVIHTVRVEIVHRDQSVTVQSHASNLTVTEADEHVASAIAARVVMVGSWQVDVHRSFTTRIFYITDLRHQCSDVRVVHTSVVLAA